MLRIPAADQVDSLYVAEALALGSTVLAFALTVLAVTTTAAVETNPGVLALVEAIGWAGAGVAAVLTVAGVFAVYRRVRNTAPRVVLAGSGLVAAVGVADLLKSVWVTAMVGLPETVSWISVAGTVGPVAILAGVLFARPRRMVMFIREQLPRPKRRQARRTAVLAIVLVAALSAPLAWVALPDGTNASPVDTAEAATVQYMYTASGDGTIKNVTSDGSTQWSYSGGASSWYDLATDSDGHLWGVSALGTVSELDADGNELTSFSFGSNDLRSIAVGPDDYLYIGDAVDTLYKVHPSNGSTIWSIQETDQRVTSIAVASNGDIFTGRSDPSANDYDTISYNQDQSTRWSNGGGAYVHAMNLGPDENVVYAGHKDIEAIYTANGTTAWSDSFTDNNPHVDGIRYTSDRVYAAGVDGVHAYDLSGNSKWSVTGTKYYSLGYTNGYLYTGDIDGAIHEFDASSQSETGSFSPHSAKIWEIIAGGVKNQDKQTLSGTVTDGNGNAIDGATVEANQSGSTVASTTTDSSGAYSLSVSDGSYTVKASADGYNSESKDITVSGSDKTVDFSLSSPSSGTATPTATPTPTGDKFEYTMGVCYGGEAVFDPVGAEAAWFRVESTAGWLTDIQDSLTPAETTGFDQYAQTRNDVYDGSQYEVDIKTDRAYFTFAGITTSITDPFQVFQIRVPFGEHATIEDMVAAEKQDEWRSACDIPSTNADNATTPEPTPPTEPEPADELPGELTAIGTCAVPDGTGEMKKGITVQYYDPTFQTSEITYELSYAGMTRSDTVNFESPQGFWQRCDAGSQKGIPDQGVPEWPDYTTVDVPEWDNVSWDDNATVEYPNGTEEDFGPGDGPVDLPDNSTITYPNGTTGEFPDQWNVTNGTASQVNEPRFNGTATLANGTGIPFNTTGFDYDDPVAELNGSSQAGFGGGSLIGEDAGSGSPLWLTAAPAAAAIGLAYYRRRRGGGGGSGRSTGRGGVP